MSEVEPQDTAMDVLAMAHNEASLWLLEKKLGKAQKASHITKAVNLMRSCSDLLAAEIEAADKLKAERDALVKELSARGIEVELIGGSWVWKTE